MYTRWRHVWGNFLRGTQQLGRSTSPWRIFNKRLTFNLFLMILVWLMTAFHVSASIDSHSPSFAKPSLYQTMFSIFQCHFHEPTSRDKWNTQRLELQISFMDGAILSHASRVYFLRFGFLRSFLVLMPDFLLTVKSDSPQSRFFFGRSAACRGPSCVSDAIVKLT